MKRDLDLVRIILLNTENEKECLTTSNLLELEYEPKTIAFHVELMAARGLITSKVTYAGSGSPVQIDIYGLTWEGYDYLDAIRSDKVWLKAKEATASSIGDTSLAVMKDVCTALASSLIKSSLGI